MKKMGDSVSTNNSYIGNDAIQDFRLFANDSFLDPFESGELYDLSSQRDSLYVVVPVTIIYASIFITGTIGNISTCIVIARNKSMHTATNYYLFSLAVSDLLLLISGLPAEIYLVWCKYSFIFGEAFCILRGLAAETSANASVLTITAFTIERYVAICHPFLSQTMSKLTRAIKLILLIWLVALSFGLPQALQFGIVRHEMNPKMIICTAKRIILRHSFELSTFLFFVVPMSLITVLYALIGLKLRKSNMIKRSRGRGDHSRNSRHHTGRSSRRVLKMLVAVVVAFFICWAPFHVQRLVAVYGTSTEDHVTSKSKWMEFVNLLLTYISGVLYYFSTTINPILYNIMSNKFRAAFMETLSKSCRIPGLGGRHEQRSYSSLSRSQQRIVGGYGSRTIGTAGTGLHQDSSDYSGNSIREDSPRQGASTLQRVQTDSLTGQADQPEDSTRTSSLKKASSRDRSRSRSRSSSLDKRNSCRVMQSNEDDGFVHHSIIPHKNCSMAIYPDCPGSKRKTEERSVKSCTGQSRGSNHWSQSRFYTSVKISELDDSRKKWWRLFKWLPDVKVLKLSGRTPCSPLRNRVLDETDEKREEYSMTICSIQENCDIRPL
ncbi:pyrokinin-1 receptor-like [Prorops nasuta]|uniref:pyrokinin-1 receptor-like n=1 Tax=Prorops nasuta TaxID=863751 RepID=UPI0034CE807F